MVKWAKMLPGAANPVSVDPSKNGTKRIGSEEVLHFERNYFTGVNRLTPQTELLHTSKNEVKVIPSLPAQS